VCYFIYCGDCPSFFSASRSSSRHMCVALDSQVPSCFASVEEMFSVRQKSYTCVQCKFNQVYLNQTAPIYGYVMCWDKFSNDTRSVLLQHGPPCHMVSHHINTSNLLSCLCLSGKGMSWSLDEKRRAHSLASLFSKCDTSGLFSGEVEKTLLIVKKHKMQMSCTTESSQLQSPLPIKFLPIPVQKLNIILMCVMPLMVPILRSTEHVRNFVRSSVWKYINFSNTLYDWRYIMFYFIAL